MLLRPIPFCWILLVVIAPASAENPPTQETVCARLADGYFHDLYKRTYDSLIERVEPDGFFQESLTGAYPGMFPRTVGGLVSLFLETGQLDACERLVQCVLNATVANDMERVPHVFDRRRTLRVPQTDSGPLVQIGHPTALYRLNGGHLGAQGLTAPSEPIRAVEAYLTLPPTPGRLVLTLRPTPTGEPVATAELNIKSKDAGEQWVRFEMNPAPKLTTGQRYFLIIAGETEGLVVWHGISTADGQPLAGTYAYDPPPVDKWIDHKDHVTAFAVDTGQLRHQPIDLNYPILSDRDQIDGQAHVIMAWARLAIRRGPTAFEDRTYPLVARLMSRSTDWPYILTGGYPSDLGLVRNVSLEHSREVRMWDTYDILTQSFVGAALDAMIRVAQRRNDEKYATLWQKRLESLRQAVDKHLTRQLDEKKVYLEMRLPNSHSGVPFLGMGWLNFAPVAAQWEPLDHEVMVNTVAAIRTRALNRWKELTWLAMDWTPGPGSSLQVIGKGVGWEFDFSRQHKEWTRITEWMDFIQTINKSPLYMEGATYDANMDAWTLQDPGNGEQCSWWCWAVARLRQTCGLSATP